MKTLQELATPQKQHDTLYHWEVPDGWHQGRGAFGGLVMDVILHALLDAHGQSEERPLRTVTATMCGPAMVGEAQIELEAMRLGSGTDTWRAQLKQGGELRTDVVALFGKKRLDKKSEPIAPWIEVSPLEVTPWREMDPVPMMPGLSPEFTQHFDYRVTGDFPFVGGEKKRAQGWIKPKHAGEDRRESYLAALVDAWWPAAYASMTSPRPMATITFTMEFFAPIPDALFDSPVFYRSTSPISQDGYSVEFRELWSERGDLLAMNQQTIVIIK